MRRLVIAAFLVASFAGLPSSANADSILGTTGAGWQSWTTALLNQNGSPYWDGRSSDGPQKGIGYYISGTGAFGPSSGGPGAALAFWGTSLLSTGYDSNFYLQRSDPGQLAALKIEIAGYAGVNQFGWFETIDGTSVGTKHLLFDGVATSGAAASFVPTALYGFYFNTPTGTFYTLSSKQTVDAGRQHFAVFRQTPDTYWFGMEDLRLASSDRDYNDMVVKVSSLVPEPGSLVLLGTGLIGLAAMVRRIPRR